MMIFLVFALFGYLLPIITPTNNAPMNANNAKASLSVREGAIFAGLHRWQAVLLSHSQIKYCIECLLLAFIALWLIVYDLPIP